MDKEPARQFFPKDQVNRMMAGKPPKPPSATTQVLAGTAAAVVAVNLLYNIGAPEGALAASWNTLQRSALTLGGPLALGIVAAQQLDASKSIAIQSVVASALASAGMMVTNMIPVQVDMPLLTSTAVAAAGIYGGIMLADKLL